MITFNDFITKWNGRGIDFDGAYGDQCMDLMHQYIVEVLGLTDGRILAAPIARTVFENFPNIFGNQYFDRIFNVLNDPTILPKDGDIVFWKDPYGYYFNTNTQKWEYAGHVGISKGSTSNNIVAFEQNNPSGSPCHIQPHEDFYKGVLGWLRPKVTVNPDDQLVATLQQLFNSGGSSTTKIATDITLLKQAGKI